MNIPTTVKELESLLDRLYEVQRHDMAQAFTRPVFVFTTQTKADRDQVERVILQHFQTKFGGLIDLQRVDHKGHAFSRFEFNEWCLTLVVIQLDP